MQVSMIIIIIAAELLLVATLGCIGMFVFYRKKKKLWLDSLQKTRRKIGKLKDVKRRYSTIKQNLHKLLEEKKRLLEELKDSENAPELREIIINLNSEILAKSEKYKKIKGDLKVKQEAVDELESELKDIPKEIQKEEADENSNTENNIYESGDKSSEEFDRLKSMNGEQKELISRCSFSVRPTCFCGGGR